MPDIHGQRARPANLPGSPAPDLAADAELAAAAARAAGELVRAAFRTDVEVDYKSPDQPVTAVDRQADRHLRRTLRAARPSYGWLSEESAEDVPEDAPVWVVDPLDGTWNFVEGQPGFAVCVGLVHRGTPVLGVVYNPLSDTLYRATAGGGAYRDGERIEARPYRRSKPLLVASVQELERGRLDGLRAVCEVATLGSTALKMTAVAEGRADAYVSRGPKGLWDICAAAVVATEAGAHVTRLDGAPIDYSPGSPPGQGLVVVGAGGADDLPRLCQLATADPSPSQQEVRT